MGTHHSKADMNKMLGVQTPSTSDKDKQQSESEPLPTSEPSLPSSSSIPGDATPTKDADSTPSDATPAKDADSTPDEAPLSEPLQKLVTGLRAILRESVRAQVEPLMLRLNVLERCVADNEEVMERQHERNAPVLGNLEARVRKLERSVMAVCVCVSEIWEAMF
jgi:hypothetical protein